MDMDHPEHDHSAHAAHANSSMSPMPSMAGMDMSGMDKFHGAVERRPDGSYHYPHGAYTGHVLPGSFFVMWGSWWLIATFARYLRASAARQLFSARPWHRLFFGSERVRALPIEPLVKIALPTIGMLGELWLGHGGFQHLLADDGKFNTHSLNDWQHATMYSCFFLSGAVDLLSALAGGVPPGVESAFLCLAFLGEGTLLVFHLKGPTVEILVHLILSLQVFATVFSILFEMRAPHSLVAATLRPYFTILQGLWWIQTARIMYVSEPRWDPDYMGSGMMVPVLFVVHMLWLAGAALLLLMIMRAVHSKMLGQEIGFAPLKPAADFGGGATGAHVAIHTLGDEEDGSSPLAPRSLELAALAAEKGSHYGRPTNGHLF